MSHSWQGPERGTIREARVEIERSPSKLGPIALIFIDAEAEDAVLQDLMVRGVTVIENFECAATVCAQTNAQAGPDRWELIEVAEARCRGFRADRLPENHHIDAVDGYLPHALDRRENLGGHAESAG